MHHQKGLTALTIGLVLLIPSSGYLTEGRELSGTAIPTVSPSERTVQIGCLSQPVTQSFGGSISEWPGVVLDTNNGEIFDAVNAFTGKSSTQVSGPLICVFSAANYSRIATLHGVGSGIGPFNPVNGDLYYANPPSNNVTVISGTNLTDVATVTVGNQPHALAVDPVSGSVYVATYGSPGTLSVVSGKTQAVIATLRVPQAYGGGMALDASNGILYVEGPYANNVTEVAVSNNSVVGNFTFPQMFIGPGAMVYDASLGGLVVSTLDGLQLASPLDGHLLRNISRTSGGCGEVLDPVDQHLFAVPSEFQCPSGSGSVNVISLTNGTVVATVAVGDSPGAMAYDPGTQTVFVPDIGDIAVGSGPSVTVINASSCSAVATLYLAPPVPRGGTSPPTFLDLPGYDGYILSAVIATVVVAAVVITLMRRKKKDVAPPPSSECQGLPQYPGNPQQPPYSPKR